MENIKEIKTGIGLGNLKFGMNRNQVKGILGEPTEIEKFSYTDSDEDLTESWHYDEMELSVSFDEEYDWKLSTIAISSNDFELKGKKLIGLTNAELVSTLETLGIKNLETEDLSADEGPDCILLMSEENAISFYMKKGILSEIQWGPVIVDDEVVIWPE